MHTFFTTMGSVPTGVKPSTMLPFSFETLNPSFFVSSSSPWTAWPSSSYRTRALKVMMKEFGWKQDQLSTTREIRY